MHPTPQELCLLRRDAEEAIGNPRLFTYIFRELQNVVQNDRRMIERLVLGGSLETSRANETIFGMIEGGIRCIRLWERDGTLPPVSLTPLQRRAVSAAAMHMIRESSIAARN